MQYALDKNNIRVSPTLTGQRATCFGCNDEVLSSCGRIMIWHWRHVSSNCDSWYEPESKWHREWKEKFDVECREVIIRKADSWHRADLHTHQGIVIEFQNSSIKPDDIVKREQFYVNMIWVVNSKEFSLFVSPINKSTVSGIKRESTVALARIEEDYQRELQLIRSTIGQSKNKIEYYQSYLNPISVKLSEIEFGLNDPIGYGEKLANSWINHQWNYTFSEKPKMQDIQNFFIRSIKSYWDVHNNQLPERDKKQRQLNYILGLEDYYLQEVVYKIIPFSKIPKKAFSKVRAIQNQQFKKTDLEIISFQSESDFLRIDSLEESYIFLIDPTDAIVMLTKEIDELNIHVIPAEKVIADSKQEIILMLSLFLNQIHPFYLRDAKLLEGKINERKLLISNKLSDLDKLINGKQEYYSEQKRLLEIKSKAALDDLKKADKSLFNYSWGRERKSWRFAEKTLYFDMGDEYLYERIDDELLKQIKKSWFVDFYGSQR